MTRMTSHRDSRPSTKVLTDLFDVGQMVRALDVESGLWFHAQITEFTSDYAATVRWDFRYVYFR
jgi:hypothetical protein